MGEPSSLIDLKAISEPASKLIDSVSAAIGALYEPTRIRRRARAEADAAMIDARAKAEVSEIESRAMHRLLLRETRRQKNIEAITRLAVDQLPETVSGTPVDDDWIFQFFQDCADVSNQELQLLWARLLAGEVARPGAFSLRTLNTVKLLRKIEAEHFFRFCTALWRFEDYYLVIHPTYVLDRPSLAGLQSVGLILGVNTRLRKEDFAISYHGRGFHVRCVEQDLSNGLFSLSAVGAELATIVQAEPDFVYMEKIINMWNQAGCEVRELTVSS
jgi:hypothetical protein